MNRGWTDMANALTWRYAAGGAVFGLLFPFVAMAMLLASGAVSAPATAAGIVAATHAHSPLLYLIDTAPIFLGLFAGFTGARQAQLVALNASLAQQVADKTASLRDALQRAEKTNVMISHMADHDPLTGLFNRRRMHRELAAAVSYSMRYGDPFSLVFIDLNRFKAINDSHGHEAGDRLLSGFAALLEQTTRDSDRTGRWGGDEFVVLLPHSTRQGAQEFAGRRSCADRRIGQHRHRRPSRRRRRPRGAARPCRPAHVPSQARTRRRGRRRRTGLSPASSSRHGHRRAFAQAATDRGAQALRPRVDRTG